MDSYLLAIGNEKHYHYRIMNPSMTSIPMKNAPSLSGRARWRLTGRHPMLASIGAIIVLLPLSSVIRAEDEVVSIKIRNHHFIPAEIEIPAGEKRLLVIENEDATVEEFESHSLHREKIIPPNSKASIYVGPLKPGRYEFQGEYNDATAKGAVVAK